MVRRNQFLDYFKQVRARRSLSSPPLLNTYAKIYLKAYILVPNIYNKPNLRKMLVLTGENFVRAASALPSIYNYKVATILTNNNPLDINKSYKGGHIYI
jgi:hypothetical protein